MEKICVSIIYDQKYVRGVLSMTLRLPAKKKPQPELRLETVEIYCPPPEDGLSTAEATRRLVNGYANTAIEPPTKTVGQIVKTNLLTYFNLVFFALAACIIAVGSWYNLTFMPVVLANIAIGIIQELRAKKTLDNLNIINTPKGTVIRDGAQRTIPVEQLVRDDIVVFATGSQIYADAVVVSGDCQVNEALMTGEADEIKKAAGDELMSGSFVVSGSFIWGGASTTDGILCDSRNPCPQEY